MIVSIHLLLLFTLPVIFVGVVNRTKALWAGRKGFPILQLAYDLVRLARKRPVYSTSSSWIFSLSTCIFAVTSALAAAICPLFPGTSALGFPQDYVYFAYLLAFGRIAVMLGAFDTGSSFEGMGVSREAAFSTLAEPSFFMLAGTLALFSGEPTFADLVSNGSKFGQLIPLTLAAVVVLFIMLQTESSRVPVDDPATHLELTMIHEVMVLDHSGPELALIQYGSALKMTALAGVIAALLNPYSLVDQPEFTIAVSTGLVMAIAVVVGLVESLMARLRLAAVSFYILMGLAAAVIAGVLAASGGLGKV